MPQRGFYEALILDNEETNDETQAASLSESWLPDYEPLSLSARFCLLSGWRMKFLFGPGFGLIFIQELFSILESFMTTKWIVFESMTMIIKYKQKMQLSWNRVFAANSHWGVNDLWGLWHLGGLLTFINKSLLVNTLHVSVFYLHFLGNDTLNDKL